MDKCFKHVEISAISGVIGKNNIDIRQLCQQYNYDEKKLKRFIKNNGFEYLSCINSPISISDLALKVSQNLLDQTNIDSKQIDAFFLVNQFPDYHIPPTTYFLQSQLGLKHESLLYDIIQGCPGYINTLFNAASLIETGVCEHIIVCCGEMVNHIPNQYTSQFEVFMEYGDGCAATLLSYSNKSKPLYFSSKNFGEQYQIVHDNAFGARADRIGLPLNKRTFNIDGNAMNAFIVDEVPKHINKALTNWGLNLTDLQLAICQQSSKIILAAISSMLGVTPEFCPFIAKNLGNIDSASIPLSILTAYHEYELIRQTKPVLLLAYGVGLASSLCVADLTDTKLFSILRA